MYGFASTDKVVFKQVDGVDDLYYLEDREVKLETVLNSPLPKGPVDPTFSLHWLAIEGVQPSIAQNPSEQSEVVDDSGTSPSTTNESSAGVTIKTDVQHVLSKEQQLYYQHVCTGLRSGDAKLQKAVLKSLSSDAGLHQLVPYFTQFLASEVCLPTNSYACYIDQYNE